MKFEKLNENKIRITLSIHDLEEKDISFHDFMSNSIENQDLFLDMLEKGYVPVISTVGCDTENQTYNINADTAAARIAGALKAESFIAMTDTPGILRKKDDPETLISSINVSEAPQLIREEIISGGMIPKVECCIEAIRQGVNRVFIIDGRVPHAVLVELLTDEGIGTMFK